LTTPTTHLVDSQKLSGDAYLELFEVTLNNASKLYLCNSKPRTWKGQAYEFIPIKLDSVQRSADSEMSRPKAVLANPDGIFSAAVSAGTLDNAVIKRFRLLEEDLLANPNTDNYRYQTWRVRRVMTLSRDGIQLELRDHIDGQFFQVPGRMYIPPEFKQVRLV
jgi:lambda family phage minor tail protein L